MRKHAATAGATVVSDDKTPIKAAPRGPGVLAAIKATIALNVNIMVGVRDGGSPLIGNHGVIDQTAIPLCAPNISKGESMPLLSAIGSPTLIRRLPSSQSSRSGSRRRPKSRAEGYLLPWTGNVSISGCGMRGLCARGRRRPRLPLRDMSALMGSALMRPAAQCALAM